MNAFLVEGLEKIEHRRAVWLKDYSKECDRISRMALDLTYRRQIITYKQQMEKSWQEKMELSGRILNSIADYLEKNNGKKFEMLPDMPYNDRG